MERLPNRYPKISQSHKVPLYKGLSLFYPKLLKKCHKTLSFIQFFRLLCVVLRLHLLCQLPLVGYT